MGEKGGQETPLLGDSLYNICLRSSAWPVPDTPWEVTMYVKANAKYTGTLIEYYYYYSERLLTDDVFV